MQTIKSNKHPQFETVYRKARRWVLRNEAGSKISDQKNYNQRTAKFERLVYQAFRQETQRLFNMKYDSNTWIFNKNELKTIHNGKESLKELCKSYYFESEASS